MPAVLEDQAIRKLIQVLKNAKGHANPTTSVDSDLQEWIDMLEKTHGEKEGQ